MSKNSTIIFLCAWLLLVSGVALSDHSPPPLVDPIPGAIPAGPFTLELSEIISDPAFITDVQVPPDGSNRIFVTTVNNLVMIIKNGVVMGTPFLDISATTDADDNILILSIAFHPDFAIPGAPGEGKFYTATQEPPGSGVAHFSDAAIVRWQSVLYEWRVNTSDPDQADVSSKRELIRIDDERAHVLNDITFGPDGYLYASKGDGGLDFSTAIDGTIIYGSILRVDVDDTTGNGRYSIPADNPFVGNSDGKLEEIYAYGFRNPWRMGFDRASGVLYVADVGQSDIEEINIVEAGGNYGWNDKEGSFAFLDGIGVTDDLSDLPVGFDGIDPVAEYDHNGNKASITGGIVYRGSAIPELVGYYVFGDWVSGRLMSMHPTSHVIQEIAVDVNSPQITEGIVSFGETEAGELLIATVDRSTAIVSRIFAVVGGTAIGLDTDGDGIPDDTDLCPTTDINGPVPTSGILCSGCMGDDQTIHGCNASDILDCKPGNNKSAMQSGITIETQKKFESLTGWAKQCVL